MHVVIVEGFGGPDVLDVVDQPTPAPGAGEALAEVAYAPALFLDTQMRAGRARDWFSTRPQYVPGGAAGGLGVLPVQLARATGAHAIGAGGGFAQVGCDEAAARQVTLTGIEHVQPAPDEAKQLVQRALAEAATGSLRRVIGQTFALDHAGDAHRAIESRGVIGKTLLEA